MRKTLARAVGQKLSGGQPSRLRALVGAVVVAAHVYRGLRSQ
jgi:hypothetical protein